MKKLSHVTIWIVQCFILAGCSFAPRYHRPDVNIAPEYKETGEWQPAQPGLAGTGELCWWERYQDPILNQLEAQVSVSNQSLKAALARYDMAKAALGVAESAYYPTLDGLVNVNKQQASSNIANPVPSNLYYDKLLAVTFAYEADLWGQVRNTVKASKSQARATAADLAALRLSLQSELAITYFSLREADATQKVLDQLVNSYEKALTITRNRYEGGAAPQLDVDQAELQVENIKTQATNNRLARQQYEHALAVLVGKTPAQFSLEPNNHPLTIPSITPDLPSTLLERRPDIAAAEWRVKAANAQIGIARSAFFPTINLAADFGVESSSLSNLMSSPSLIWALGPIIPLTGSLVTQTLYDGGNLKSLLKKAKASYYETVANYRQTVLTAFQEVEDNLAAQRELEKMSVSQNHATTAALRALQQASDRYQGGLTTYLQVITSQNSASEAEIGQIQLTTRRQKASVLLIKALGGGWHFEE